MKSELNFFHEGYAKYYFNIENDQNPFFLKASDESKITKKDYFIRLIPINDELKNIILDCIFYIHQELIAYQNRNTNKNNLRCISPIKIKYNDFNDIKKYLNIKKIKTTKAFQINKEGFNLIHNEKIINGIEENNKKLDNKIYFDEDKKNKEDNNKNNDTAYENK